MHRINSSNKNIGETIMVKIRDLGKGWVLEFWKDGTYRIVKRGKHGRFITWRKTEPKRKIYKYTVVIRIAYVTKRIGHSRFGEISGNIYSTTELSDTELINHAINSVKNMDYWVDYAPINEKIIIHSRMEKIEKVMIDDVETEINFKDMGSK